ncbi:hypothetical protein Peur_030280 [Populus x canadensis]
MEECLTSLVKIGVACSMDSPRDRKDMSRVVRELLMVRDTFQGTASRPENNKYPGFIKTTQEEITTCLPGLVACTSLLGQGGPNLSWNAVEVQECGHDQKGNRQKQFQPLERVEVKTHAKDCMKECGHDQKGNQKEHLQPLERVEVKIHAKDCMKVHRLMEQCLSP